MVMVYINSFVETVYQATAMPTDISLYYVIVLCRRLLPFFQQIPCFSSRGICIVLCVVLDIYLIRSLSELWSWIRGNGILMGRKQLVFTQHDSIGQLEFG